MILARQNKNGKYHNKVGFYYPINKEKYKSSTTPIYKSDLERRMMRYLDSTDAVLSWIYEPTCIRYIDLSTIDPRTNRPGKYRRYFVDFIASVKQKDGTIKNILIEVKSKKETIEPKNKTNINEYSTWIKNNCKWNAAKKFCESKGMAFVIITDEQLT